MKLFACVIAIGVSSVAWAKDPIRGHEIAESVDRANSGFVGEASQMEMVLENANGDKTTRKMKSIVREMQKDGDKSRIEFMWPPGVRGTRMLTWTHKLVDDDQWLYLPAAKKTKRITARNKSGSFMGSEIAYEDLASPEIEKYKHFFLAEETLNGRKVWKTERVPKDKRSGYSKQIVWIDQGYMNTVKIEYYDRKGKLLKTGTFENWERYKKWWRADTFSVTNHQTRKKSAIIWKKRKLMVEHDDTEFQSGGLAD